MLPSGVRNTFLYNGDGQRVQKQDSTGTTKHVWDGQNILLETDGSNIIQVVYTLEPALYGNVISQRRGGVTSFYLFDGLGSTRQLANSTGSVTDSYLHDSWGNILLISGTTTNWLRYVGRMGYYYDADLIAYFLRARNYNSQTGSFLSRDPSNPILNSEQDVASKVRRLLRPYEYCTSNPPNRVDPSGLDWLDCMVQCMNDMLVSNRIAAGVTGVIGLGGLTAKKEIALPRGKPRQALLTKISQRIGGPGLRYTSMASKFCGRVFLAIGVADAAIEVYCAGKCAL
jgi:RHS repeat-associated protein